MEGRLEYLHGGELPKLKPGSIADLIVSAEALVDASDDALLSQSENIVLLPAGTMLMVRVSAQFHGECDRAGLQEVLLSDRGRSPCVPLRLSEPLSFCWRGHKKGKLAGCKVTIPALQDRETISLNHAYRLVSEAFEPARVSHSGNVFQEVYVLREPSGWRPLDELRGEHEGRLAPRLARDTGLRNP